MTMPDETLWTTEFWAEDVDAPSGRLASIDEYEDLPVGVEIEEYRPASFADAHVDAKDLLEVAQEWLGEREPLVHDDGGPDLVIVEGPELDALQAALDNYVKAHVDLDEAAWLPTGRTAKKTETGWEFSG